MVSAIAWLAVVLMMILLIVLPTGAFLGTLGVVAVFSAMAATIAAILCPPPDAPPPDAPPLRVARWGVPAVATALLATVLLTLLPMPLSWSALGGASRHAQNVAVDDVILSAEALEVMPPVAHTYSLTRNGAGTVRWSLLLIATVSVALLTARFGPTARETYLRVLTLLGAAVAVGGLISLTIAPQGFTLWWIYPAPPDLPGPLACFRNRNHFAAFLALLSPAALALLARDLTRGRILAALVSLVTVATLGLGVAASLSRGGMLAYAAGLAACIALFLAYRRWDFAVLIATVAALAIAALLLAPAPALRERLATFTTLKSEHSYQTRLASWLDGRRILAAYPGLGAGANGFRIVYPQFRSTTHGGIMSYAENAYVQWATDMGSVGIGLGAALLVAGFVAAWPALRNRASITISVSALGGLAVVAVHSLFDDPLRIPLYAIPLASVLGLALPPQHPRSASLRDRLVNTAPALSCLLAALILLLAWGERLNDDIADFFPTMPIHKLARALAWAPTSQFAWVTFGERIAEAKTPESNLLARQCYARAVQYDPNNYRLWDHIGYLRLGLGDNAGARDAFAHVKALRSWKSVPDIPQDK
ncbi:MAG: O-antigen ligase family protein [Lentisphaerae bacterium]|nr:O-antigen ligase family protein [Lentisphaerota bacterium]